MLDDKISEYYAKYYKCALQVNPYTYAKYRGEKINPKSENNYNEQILKNCLEKNIKIVGLADHGSIETSNSLREKLEKNDIVVFPGFEITSAEKIHMVCLFPENTKSMDLNRILGEVGLSVSSTGNDTSEKTCLDIAKTIRKENGFWYAAHITSDNGILKLGKLNNVWKDKSLVAAQIPNSRDKVDPKYKNIINNSDPNYKREKLPAFINACDIKDPNDLNKDTAVTLIKLSNLSFDSFKMAFTDPESRVKLQSELENNYQSSIEDMAVTGGYLDGFKVAFSNNLTTIIGGRGTGKSTIINLIRYALDLPIDKEQKKNFDDMIKFNLGMSAKVELTIVSNKQYGERFKIIRRYGEQPVIKNKDDEISQLKVIDIMPSIEIYGQNEIVNIVNSQEKKNKVVQRLFPENSVSKSKKKDAYSKLVENGKKLDKKEKQLERLNKEIDELPNLKEKRKFYDKTDIKNKLPKIVELSEQEGQFSSIGKQIPSDDLDIPIISYSDSISKNEDFKNLIKAVKEHNKNMKAIKIEYNAAIQDLKEKYSIYYDNWKNYKQQFDEDIKSSLKTLDGINDKSSTEIANDYSEVIKKISEMESTKKACDKIKKEIELLKSERANLIEKYRTCREGYENEVKRKLDKINKTKLKGTIHLAIKFRQQKQDLIDLLENINGIGDKALLGIAQKEEFDVFRFVQEIHQIKSKNNEADKNKFIEDYKLTTHSSDKIIGSLKESNLRDIEELQLLDLIEIELKVNGNFKKLENLSKGQQCTAILNILLLDNKDPLIIDQPEDNLDNSFVASNLVKIIRDNKIKRQYIFATHNANIPVFGDAELILTMEEKNNVGQIAENGLGSIDSQNVKNSVVQILEGGTKAFKIREEKYGINQSK